MKHAQKPLPSSKEYLERVNAFDNVVSECIQISKQHEGIASPTAKHFYASVLFTLLCTRSVSLAILMPYSPWASKVIEQWDYASVANLTRSILEIRLAFYYLCIERCPQDEWECRWNVFNLHDCQSRIRLFEELHPENEDIQGFQEQALELRTRLEENLFFKSLPEKQQAKFLRGRDAYMTSLEEICEKSGTDRHTFRWLYQFLSNHVHGLPMSFYRMGEQERGRGVHSNTEEGYISLFLSFTVTLLVRSRDEFIELFSTQK